MAMIKMDECIVSNGEVSTTKMKSDSDAADIVPVSVSEEEEAHKDDEEDNDNDDDNNNDNNDDNNNNDNKEGIFDFDLNDVEGMSEYELMRLQKIRRNEAKPTSLGLLGGMTSTAPPPRTTSIERNVLRLKVIL